MTGTHQASGMHLIADLYGIDDTQLSDPDAIEKLLRESAVAAGATIIYSHFHVFGEGQGITGVVLLAESHISIHTWPELGFAAADVFMCGSARPEVAVDIMVDALKPTSTRIQHIARGRPQGISGNEAARSDAGIERAMETVAHCFPCTPRN
ncbi:adenosylmethionine decarboxylase [Noviherbaspirillum saxi]|uniref:S-adenosylmethionine decarboxylase proenzyme n=1 Tax=Noviherbaspirillum saxi TaxID=2320863 RepID=A0A3A3G5B1_9BURK|nr:adenosylmethionine decarboxylase [Noviherbaspirillum saxi]